MSHQLPVLSGVLFANESFDLMMIANGHHPLDAMTFESEQFIYSKIILLDPSDLTLHFTM